MGFAFVHHLYVSFTCEKVQELVHRNRWTSKNHDALISSKDFRTNQLPWSPRVRPVQMSHSSVPSAHRRRALSGSITV